MTNKIEIKSFTEPPQDYTGFVIWNDGTRIWYKNGKRHRDDGVALVHNSGYKAWWLDGKIIWDSGCKLNLTNQIILSKHQHPIYPTIQVWKILNKNKVYERIIIPGMEEHIQE